MKLQLTVNELSKIVDLSPGTLRYYCNSGIFKESGIHENGYRYFTIEKIEEIRLITYLRHLGVPLKEIEQHLNNRNINEFEEILTTQLTRTREKIAHLERLELRLNNRLKSLDYIRSLPELDCIHVERFNARQILRLNITTNEQYDFEKELLKFQSLGNLPPSLIIGDQGFIVDLEKWNVRKAEEFIGMYMLADDPYIKEHILLDELPEGEWLTIYFRGDHDDALTRYKDLVKYAEEKNITLGSFALERILIDHYISNDASFYITEIQIPIENDL